MRSMSDGTHCAMPKISYIPAISFAAVLNEFVLANLVHQLNWRLPAESTEVKTNVAESTGTSSDELIKFIVCRTSLQAYSVTSIFSSLSLYIDTHVLELEAFVLQNTENHPNNIHVQ
ncbi:hypothetical protein YC2023_101594 [Brassica napus]